MDDSHLPSLSATRDISERSQLFPVEAGVFITTKPDDDIPTVRFYIDPLDAPECELASEPLLPDFRPLPSVSVRIDSNCCKVVAAEVSQTAHQSYASDLSSVAISICRICHMPETEGNRLVSPCRCSGTMQHIHNGCLLKWLDISMRSCKQTPRCELCLYQYHRHKTFKHLNQWIWPDCSRMDKLLHLVFVLCVATMIICATVTILCFKQEKAPDGLVRLHLERQELSTPEAITLACGVLFFVSFFIAMYVEVKARVTICRIFQEFLHLNQKWRFEEYAH